MFRTLSTILIVTFTTVAIGASQPQQQAGPRGARMQRPERLMERLNLTTEQKTQMRKLWTDLEKKQIPIHSKIQLARVEIRELFMAEKPDRAAIERKMKEVSDLQYQTKLNNLDLALAARGILSKEQQEQLWDWIVAPGGGGHPMMRGGRGMGRWGGPMGNELSPEDGPDLGMLDIPE